TARSAFDRDFASFIFTLLSVSLSTSFSPLRRTQHRDVANQAFPDTAKSSGPGSRAPPPTYCARWAASNLRILFSGQARSSVRFLDPAGQLSYAANVSARPSSRLSRRAMGETS